MTDRTAGTVSRVCVVGTGVIGSGWAARCLARGLDVVATDPAPGAEGRLRASVANAWPALARSGLAPGAAPERLEFSSELAAAVGAADFVQESAPENEELKRRLLARIDAAARPGVIIASSSSGLLPSRIQADCAEPGRVLIGHPFNPVYLLPLVEVVGGSQTSADAIAAASDFYRDIGMRPLHVRKEIEGYISDRLQESIWREALHMVADGVATTAEIDRAITDGPGLRWAFMGPCLTFHLAGGDVGMAHMLEQFGPALALPWTHTEAPPLSEELIRRMVEGTSAQAAGRSVKQIEQRRDECLIRIQELLAQSWEGEGRIVVAGEGTPAPQWDPARAIDAPLALYRGTVRRAWVDYNGHMNDAAYLLAFDDALDALFRYIGIDEGYRAEGRSFYTVETHVSYLREVGEGEPLRVTTQLLDLDDKRMHLYHAMYHDRDGTLLATGEQLELHVATGKPAKAAAMPADIQDRLQAIRRAHATLPRPEHAGRAVAMRRG